MEQAEKQSPFSVNLRGRPEWFKTFIREARQVEKDWNREIQRRDSSRSLRSTFWQFEVAVKYFDLFPAGFPLEAALKMQEGGFETEFALEHVELDTLRTLAKLFKMGFTLERAASVYGIDGRILEALKGWIGSDLYKEPYEFSSMGIVTREPETNVFKELTQIGFMSGEAVKAFQERHFQEVVNPGAVVEFPSQAQAPAADPIQLELFAM